MNKRHIATVLILLFGAGAAYVIAPSSPISSPSDSGQAFLTVHPISHATAVLTWGETVLYTDPVGGGEAFDGKSPADLVLVTDIHGDHFSEETLRAVLRNGGTLIAPQAVADLLPDEISSRALVLANGDVAVQNGFRIEAIPMYNLPESEESRHPKARGNGYLLEKDGHRVYIAGDTAGIPEMRALSNIDVAFIPMNPPYTMHVEEAADAVLDFAPSVVYPYHYRGQDGLSDTEEFKRLVNTSNPSIQVILLNWYP